MAVPVAVTPVLSSTSTGLANVTAQATAASAAVSGLADEQQRAGVAASQAARQQANFARDTGQVEKAVIASSAGFLGLRGAVLTAGGAFIAATVGIQAFARAVQSAAELESQLNVFQVTTGATAEQMERVSAEARALGRDLRLPGVTALDATQSFLTLARAGLTVEEALAGARGTLQLATAAEITFADSAQLTASALNAFGLAGQNAVAVADVLTNAANASQASIAEMGIALQQSAAIADLVGFSLSETVTFLTQLAQAGLKGSDAGTSFRVAMQRLIAPTGKARTELDRLNIQLRDAEGGLRPEAFFELGDALDRMGRAQADATRQVIFGNDASRAAAFFARLNVESFREQERAINEQGSAAEVAAARNKGFAGQIENLKNQATDLGIELGEIAIGPLGIAAGVVALAFAQMAAEIRLAEKGLEQVERAGEGVGRFLRDAAEGAADFVREIPFIGQLSRSSGQEVGELSDRERELAEAIHDAVRPTQDQVRTLTDLERAAAAAAQAVSQLANQQRGLEEQTTRARIAGDEGGELASLQERRANLQRELELQEEIIARPGTAGEATAREAIRQRILPQLEAVNNEIDNIIEGQKSRREQQAREAQQVADDADRDILNALSSRREDAERRATAAAETTSLNDDIKAQDRIQALIKIQIQKVRERIKDEQTRKQAIRELRQELIDSRNEEEQLRAAQKANQQERAAQLLDIKIQIAQERGNEALEEQLLRIKIRRLKKQIKEAKGQQLLVAQLTLELAQTQNELKDLDEQQRDTAGEGNRAAEFFFEQLQAQQGFAANLLGNLIPRDQTGGLVGLPSPAGPVIPNLGAAAGAAAGAAQGRAMTAPTSGQVSTTNDILLRILAQLKGLNSSASAPEAVYQKNMGKAAMTGGGGNVEVM